MLCFLKQLFLGLRWLLCRLPVNAALVLYINTLLIQWLITWLLPLLTRRSVIISYISFVFVPKEYVGKLWLIVTLLISFIVFLFFALRHPLNLFALLWRLFYVYFAMVIIYWVIGLWYFSLRPPCLMILLLMAHQMLTKFVFSVGVFNRRIKWLIRLMGRFFLVKGESDFVLFLQFFIELIVNNLV